MHFLFQRETKWVFKVIFKKISIFSHLNLSRIESHEIEEKTCIVSKRQNDQFFFFSSKDYEILISNIIELNMNHRIGMQYLLILTLNILNYKISYLTKI
jgi:hypothetical protein